MVAFGIVLSDPFFFIQSYSLGIIAFETAIRCICFVCIVAVSEILLSYDEQGKRNVFSEMPRECMVYTQEGNFLE